ncbi:CHAD domain-containing protein [Patulibacter sp.]|uniref:CHAD domain-containing protein n=1 Tax=Patulibacter sp. TaxID=1912859 RepID=UPI002721527F|nr:CHAD domain-containing protein [Patulibacter sp.]MDO9409853.1 CHAD domain-containing protein [Patulibacter sp.]
MVKALPIPGLRADTPYGLAAAATVRVRADELVAQAAGVLDTGHIERVHGMRVATRRLRAVLEIYAPCFPPAELKRTLREVKALADALGARRDPDVQLEGLDRFAATLPEADRPGIEGFMGVVREDQEAGNVVLAAALERLDPATLRERIEVLVRAAEDAVPDALRGTGEDDGSGADDEVAPDAGGDPVEGGSPEDGVGDGSAADAVGAADAADPSGVADAADRAGAVGAADPGSAAQDVPGRPEGQA